MKADITNRNHGMKMLPFLSHVIVISMLFLLPELIMSYVMPSHHNGRNNMQWVMYAKSAVFITIFYIDYYFIIGHTLIPKVRIWRFLGYNALILIGAIVLSYATWYYFAYRPRIAADTDWPLRNPDKYRLMFMSQLVRDAVMIILTISLAFAMRLSDRWSALERHRREMADAQRAFELSNLKSQLNPHFLFNTLNSIYALIEISPSGAQAAVGELSQMLRYMLYETPSQVSLQHEVDFTDNYISLMKLRLPQGVIEVNIDIKPMAESKIAPLLFIPLVENAFKHGNTGDPDDHISISMTAKDGEIICDVTNHFDPQCPATTTGKTEGGIGIANLRRRLQLIYGHSASLTTETEGDRYRAVLTIKPDHIHLTNG